MDNIENFLMHTMNTLGVDQLKASGVGTAFKAVQNSVQMQDAASFKNFVFTPAVDGIVNYLTSSGYAIQDVDYEAISNIIRDLPMWDMIDFRAGKKGIVDYTTNE